MSLPPRSLESVPNIRPRPGMPPTPTAAAAPRWPLAVPHSSSFQPWATGHVQRKGLNGNVGSDGAATVSLVSFPGARQEAVLPKYVPPPPAQPLGSRRESLEASVDRESRSLHSAQTRHHVALVHPICATCCATRWLHEAPRFPERAQVSKDWCFEGIRRSSDDSGMWSCYSVGGPGPGKLSRRWEFAHLFEHRAVINGLMGMSNCPQQHRTFTLPAVPFLSGPSKGSVLHGARVKTQAATYGPDVLNLFPTRYSLAVAPHQP